VKNPSFSTWPVSLAVRSWARKRCLLLDLARQPRRSVLGAEALHVLAERLRRHRLGRDPFDPLVLGREQHEGGAVDRVDAGREHLDIRRVGRARFRGRRADAGRQQGELHPGAFRPPDPVPLHRQDLLRPCLQPIRGVQQFLGVVRDAKEPLLQVAAPDEGAAAPAPALDHLLVGEHRVATRTPVDRRALAVGQVALEHPDEQPLVPLVVVGQARGNLAVPRVADPQPLQLALHVRDVGQRRRLGVDALLDGCVLGRQAKRVPPEGVQHVEPAHALLAGHHVANHVVANVAHVSVPGRIGEHLEAVELRLRRVLGHLEGTGLHPALLPLPVERLRYVLAHVSVLLAPDGSTGRRRVERHGPVVAAGGGWTEVLQL